MGEICDEILIADAGDAICNSSRAGGVDNEDNEDVRGTVLRTTRTSSVTSSSTSTSTSVSASTSTSSNSVSLRNRRRGTGVICGDVWFVMALVVRRPVVS